MQSQLQPEEEPQDAATLYEFRIVNDENTNGAGEGVTMVEDYMKKDLE